MFENFQVERLHIFYFNDASMPELARLVDDNGIVDTVPLLPDLLNLKCSYTAFWYSSK